MQKQRIAIIAAIVFVLFSSVLSLLGPYYIGIIIDDYIIPRDVSGSVRMAIILAGIYVFASIFTWLQQYVMIHVSLRTIRNIRSDLFAKLQSLSLRFFDQRSHGELMSRVTNDIDNMNNALTQSVVQIFSSALTIIGVAIAMIALNWILAIVSFWVIPLMIWASKVIIQFSSRNFSKRQKDLGELNGFVEESISGKEVITLFGKEKDSIAQFGNINENLRTSAMLADTYSGFLGPVNNFINNLGIALIIGTGALLTLNGMTTVGVIASFVTYSRLFFRPINQLSSLMNTLQAAIAGAERVFEIMDEVPDLTDSETAVGIERIKGEVEFKKVHFGYNSDKEILKGISLRAKPGETIALVGPTGSGKTTIINLLSRFYDFQSGSIIIDGQDIKDYRIDDLRKRIGIVLQETYLFSGTLMENIRYGRLDATDEEVIQAAKVASAHQFIKHLPGKYETIINSGGKNLSQGQRQLLAIARAVLANSDILILDEATSSIDTRTEIAIQSGMHHLTEGRTTFVIAHRLKTIENADRIYVIHDGEIIEEGTHTELLRCKGFYFRLYESQFNV
nr:ABC transporter ATP-binding protein [Peribacillus faecalis]